MSRTGTRCCLHTNQGCSWKRSWRLARPGEECTSCKRQRCCKRSIGSGMLRTRCCWWPCRRWQQTDCSRRWRTSGRWGWTWQCTSPTKIGRCRRIECSWRIHGWRWLCKFESRIGLFRTERTTGTWGWTRGCSFLAGKSHASKFPEQCRQCKHDPRWLCKCP